MKHFSIPNLYEKCTQCKLCNAVCPIFSVKGKNADSPLGQLLVLKNLARQPAPKLPPAYLLDSCILCGKCDKACPANLPLSKLFFSAKLFLEKRRKKAMREKAAFLFQQNPHFDAIKPLLKIIRETKCEHIGEALPYRAKNVAGSKKTRILLFQGCIAKRERPRLARAASKALDANNYDVLAPASLRCCGRAAGFTERAFLAACKANLRVLSRVSFDYLATICPACANIIKNVWPALDGLAAKDCEMARKIAAKTHYIGSYLHASLPAAETGISWHRGCLLDEDSGKMTKIALGLTGQDEVNLCCGSDCEEKVKSQKSQEGLFAKESMTASQMLARNCRDALVETHADAVVTACPHCMKSLEAIFLKKRDKIRIRHAVEHYALFPNRKPGNAT